MYHVAIKPSGSIIIHLIICLQAWERLERAEHERERVLRDELIRQEKLEQMARRFDRKAAMRETWLQENQRLVAQVKHQQQTYGHNMMLLSGIGSAVSHEKDLI